MNGPFKQLTVIGASRGIGLETVELALAKGYRVNALARNFDDAPHSAHLKKIRGNILHPHDVERSIEKSDTIVVSVGIPPTRKPVSLFSTGINNVLNAMKQMKTDPLLIVVAGIGAGHTRGHGGFAYDRVFFPLFLKSIYEDKDRMIKTLKESNHRWIVANPGFLTDGPGIKKYWAFVDLNGVRARKISRADVADFILKQAENPSFLHKEPLLSN